MEGRGLSPAIHFTRWLRNLMIHPTVHRFLARVCSLTFISLTPHHSVTSRDQLTSLVYSFSGTYFVGCFYTRFFSKFPLMSVPALPNLDSDAPFPGNVKSFTNNNLHLSLPLPSLAYETHAQEAWSKCAAAPNWGWYYLLAMLPFAARFIQSLRRYRDSNLPTHLINVRTSIVFSLSLTVPFK